MFDNPKQENAVGLLNGTGLTGKWIKPSLTLEQQKLKDGLKKLASFPVSVLM